MRQAMRAFLLARATTAFSTRPLVSLDIRDDRVAVLTIGRFGMGSTAQRIIEAMHAVARQQPAVLVVDLRENPGGDLSAMLVAGYIVSEPIQGGLFLARKWWDEHDSVPPPAEWESLPRLSEPDLDAFQRTLAEEGVVVGVVPPLEPRYGKPVYLLTSGRTGSAAEPLVVMLQAVGRATVVGERTAGMTLSSTKVDLADGWAVRFPAADYFTAQRARLEGAGVQPDVAVPAGQALEWALRLAKGRYSILAAPTRMDRTVTASVPASNSYRGGRPESGWLIQTETAAGWRALERKRGSFSGCISPR